MACPSREGRSSIKPKELAEASKVSPSTTILLKIVIVRFKARVIGGPLYTTSYTTLYSRKGAKFILLV